MRPTLQRLRQGVWGPARHPGHDSAHWPLAPCLERRSGLRTHPADGETNPLVLADMAKGKMRRKIPELAQALEGHFDAHHARLARSILARIDQVQAALTEL